MDRIDDLLDRITRPSTRRSRVHTMTEVHHLLRELGARPPLNATQATRCLQVLDAHNLSDPELRAWLQAIKLRSPPQVARVFALLTHAGAGRVAQLEVTLCPGPRTISTVHPLDARAREASEAAMQAALLAVHEDYSVLWQLIDAQDLALQVDGRSLGLALAVGVQRALQGRPALPGVAFTGGLTNGGQLMSVGEVPAKLRAARDAGLTQAWVPPANLPEAEAGLEVRARHTLAEVMSALDAAEAPAPDAAEAPAASSQSAQAVAPDDATPLATSPTRDTPATPAAPPAHSPQGASAPAPASRLGAATVGAVAFITVIALAAGALRDDATRSDLVPEDAPSAAAPPSPALKQLPPARAREYLSLCLLRDGELVDLDAELRTGQAVHIRLTPPAEGFVDLLYADPGSARVAPLYPGSPDERVRLGRDTISLPEADPILLSDPAQSEPLYLLWSPGEAPYRLKQASLKGAPAVTAPAIVAAHPELVPLSPEPRLGQCADYRIQDPTRPALLRLELRHVPN